MGELDGAEEATCTTTERQSVELQSASADAGGTASIRGAWIARHFDVASQVLLIDELLGRASDCGSPVTLLRRASGGILAIRDSLYAVYCAAERPERALAANTLLVRYVDCVYWWFQNLLGELEALLSGAAGREDAASLDSIAEFSSLYVLAQLMPLHAGMTEASSTHDDHALGPVRHACNALHEDVTWLAWQLKEANDS